MDKVCRCCLASDGAVVVQNISYQVFYQQITNVPFLNGSGKPISLCCDCLYLFRKGMQLRDKCVNADKILNEMITNGVELSPESILKINRSKNRLSSKCVIARIYSFEIGKKYYIKTENDCNELSENCTDDGVTQTEQTNEVVNNCANGSNYLVHDIINKENMLPEKNTHNQTDVRLSLEQVSSKYKKCKVAMKYTDRQVVDHHLNKDVERNCQKNGDSTSTGKKPSVAQSDKQVTGTRPYKCDFCNYKSSQKGHLDSHIRTHTGEKPYKCDLCNYKSSQKGHLDSHIRTHTKEKPYNCDLCNYSSSLRSTLIRHIRTHTGEKPYKCDLCNYKGSRKGHLESHIRTHTGEKPYKCDLCNYKSSQKGHLDSHIRTHTGEKPYKCDLCNYKGSRKEYLDSHIRSHTGEKPYKCDLCNYKCLRKGHLDSHIRTHTGEKPYKCDLCDYQGSLKETLVRHMKTHTREKPYKCDLCDYQGSLKETLVRHMKTHTGEKPYKCDLCDYQGSLKETLVRHIYYFHFI